MAIYKFGKIYRYDATKSLYFACLNQLDDPFEGWVPRRNFKILEEVIGPRRETLLRSIQQLREQSPETHLSTLDDLTRDANLRLSVQHCLDEANQGFAVNCWHINEYESAGMWKLYGAAEGGIAILSSRQRLEKALRVENFAVDEVRYIDFDDDEIEKGHKHGSLFVKRHSFAHERELRAVVVLAKSGEGVLVPCDLNCLIEAVYVSPLASSVYINAVRYVIERSDMTIKPQISVSTLLNRPNY